jgi:serine/threonine protein kinase
LTVDVGSTIGRYRLLGRLGIGGGGIVYEAEDTELGRLVALKFVVEELADDPESVRRFKREAQTIALLNHDNICTIYGLEEHDGRAFITMERLQGVSLKLHIARKTLPTEEVIDIAAQIAHALDAAHQKGIVHRDIKSGNIMVCESGRVKVLDFGLARRYRSDDSAANPLYGSTIPGRPIGTANYMAPERIRQEPLDPRSDLFSLGVVMYEMATGRLPFAGASPYETVVNIFERTPVPLTKLAADRPVALERLVKRLLEKSADDRFQSAADVRRALVDMERRLTPRSVAKRLRRVFTKTDRRAR